VNKSCQCVQGLYGTNAIADTDARFANVAPIALFYSETSSQKNEVSKLIRKFYFGDSAIGNDSVASVVNVSGHLCHMYSVYFLHMSY
jgi:hypothetical protein